ncbi:MAG: class IV adenylate cyclase [Planctomycetota bacterium]
MAFEIEAKYRLPDQGQALRLILAELGAEALPGCVVADTYLRHPSRDFAETGEAFRIRREGDHNALTYKGPKKSTSGIKTRTEIEIGLSSGDQVFAESRAMFKAMGFREVLTIEKFREPFSLNYNHRKVTVVLDEAGALGHFAEVELIVVDETDQTAAETFIKAMAKRLGLIDYEPRSYLRMWLEHAERGK